VVGPPQQTQEKPGGLIRLQQKRGPDFHPAPKALGNGGVSSREDEGMLRLFGKESVNRTFCITV
jgi:hypothetical protein